MKNGRHYGTVELAEGRWRVEAEPHILLRLKRVFEKIDKRQHGAVTLADTPENCRELEWFRQRYPLRLVNGAAARLTAGAKAHRDHVVRMEELIDPAYRPPAFDGLALPPRDYQSRAAVLLLQQGHLLLVDELGLGKTCTAICTFTDRRALPAVVVAYPHLQRQWCAEVAKFAPGLFVHLVKAGTPYELPRRDGRGPDVLLITYNKLGGWAEALAAYARSIVFDEVQELRRRESQKYAAAAHVAAAATFRLGLTATPIYNYGGEMFNILDVLKPDALGTYEEFYREWCAGSEPKKARVKDPRAFGTYLREQFLMLARTRRDVGRELPDVIRVPHQIEADAAALDQVADAAGELARIILGHSGAQARGEAMQAAEEFSNILRQATGIAKAPYVAEFVRLIVSSGERVLLCGWHRAVYDLWAARLTPHGVRVTWFTGSESPTQKDQAKADFVAGNVDVMFMSLRSGAGLDGLQEHCRVIVFGELDWSPGVHEQCIGRLNRDGQRDPVTAYFLVSEHGADPVIAEVLGLKREQIDGIRRPDKDLVEKLDAGGANARKLAEHYLQRRSP